MALTFVRSTVGDYMSESTGEPGDFISWSRRGGLNFRLHAWRLATLRRAGQYDFHTRPIIRREWRWRLPITWLGEEFLIRVPSGRVVRTQRRLRRPRSKGQQRPATNAQWVRRKRWLVAGR